MPCCEVLALCFLLEFIKCWSWILDLGFRSLINFELHSVTEGSNFILIDKDVQFSWYRLLKRLSFPYWLALTPLSKIIWPYVWGFISGLSILFHWFLCPLMLVLCSYYGSFLVSFEISKCGWVLPLCLFKIVLTIGYSLRFHNGF